MQKLMGAILVLLMITGILWALEKFIRTDYFKIKKIEITGNNVSLKLDIIDKINNLKEQNIAFINFSEIEKMLKSDIRIEKVEIKRNYPSKIFVNIEERKPYVYVKKGNQIFLADKELNLFGLISETLGENIPIVTYNDDNTQKDLKIILSKIESKELYDVISEIKQVDNEYRLILLNGIVVVTDTSVDTERYNEVMKLYEKIKNRQIINNIDIRFKEITVR